MSDSDLVLFLLICLPPRFPPRLPLLRFFFVVCSSNSVFCTLSLALLAVIYSLGSLVVFAKSISIVVSLGSMILTFFANVLVLMELTLLPGFSLFSKTLSLGSIFILEPFSSTLRFFSLVNASF